LETTSPEMAKNEHRVAETDDPKPPPVVVKKTKVKDDGRVRVILHKPSPDSSLGIRFKLKPGLGLLIGEIRPDGVLGGTPLKAGMQIISIKPIVNHHHDKESSQLRDNFTIEQAVKTLMEREGDIEILAFDIEHATAHVTVEHTDGGTFCFVLPCVIEIKRNLLIVLRLGHDPTFAGPRGHVLHMTRKRSNTLIKPQQFPMISDSITKPIPRATNDISSKNS